MKPIRFRNDKRLRDKLFTSENYLHPAKGHLGLWQAIIEKYTAPGDTILDPMAGVGATLTAALMGRNVVCVELEPHWVTPMKASWEKMRQHPMLGHELGQVLILRGDARALPLGSADGILTSPPYPGAWGAEDSTYEATQQRERRHRERHPEYLRPPIPGAYTRPSAIITSPPYEGSLVESDTYERTADKVRRGDYKGKRPDVWVSPTNIGAQGFSSGYTRPSAIITSPPFQSVEPWQDKGFEMHDGRKQPKRGATSPGYTRKPVDAVVSSPPYEGITLAGGDVEKRKIRVEAEYGNVGEYRRSLQAQGKDSHHTFDKGQYAQQGYIRPVDVVVTKLDEVADVRYNKVWRKPAANTSQEPASNAELNVTAGLNGAPDVIIGALQQDVSPPLLIEPRLQQALAERSIISGQGEEMRGGGQDGQKQGGRLWNEQNIPANPVGQQTKSFNSTTEGTVERLATGSIPPEISLSSALAVTTSQRQLKGNVGNLRGQAYWDSMSEIYQECHRVLKPGGIMALVLKGFTRDGQYVDLPAQTADLVESLGFVKFDEWRRELWSLSFWRVLQGTDKEETVVAHRQGLFDLDIQEVKRMKRVSNGKLDERLRFETVLAFRKGT